MAQDSGIVGRLVGKMIERSVRRNFRNLLWVPPTVPLVPSCVLFANHHGWYDGYIMYHVVKRLKIDCVDWIEEFDAFPLFSRIGGMRFAKDEKLSRAVTIRSTVRMMKELGKSLVIFPEGVLHYPPDVQPFGRALQFIATNVPGVQLVPVAIAYELSMHERGEAFVRFGTPISGQDFELEKARRAVDDELGTLRNQIRSCFEFDILAEGTRSVNERWDMRKWRKP